MHSQTTHTPRMLKVCLSILQLVQRHLTTYGPKELSVSQTQRKDFQLNVCVGELTNETKNKEQPFQFDTLTVRYRFQ